MSGGGTSGSSTTQTSLPSALQPLANLYNTQAQAVAGTPYAPYEGDRFAAITPDQQAAYDMMRQTATAGSPVMNTASEALQQIIKGGNTNPYLDKMVGSAQQNLVDQYQNTIAPQQSARMAGSGSFGNSGVDQSIGMDQNNFQRNIADIGTTMYGNAYNTDRANQLAGISQAIPFANQAYVAPQALLATGNAQQAQAQQGNDFNYQQWQDAQNQPYKNLATLASPFSINQGGTTSTTSQGGGK